MFQARTVFVIGAGASCELNLPAGDGLMTKIVESLAPNRNAHGFGNDAILRVLVNRMQREHGHGWGAPMARFREAAAKIVKALPYARSIDTYLDSQQDDTETVFLGKLAITQAILQAERGSHLVRTSDVHSRFPNHAGLMESWYIPLARTLTSGHRANNIDTIFDNVSFIVFNYDRCLELFLLRMVTEYFAVDNEAAQRALSKALIIHAYGSVGDLMRLPNAQAPFIPFGGGDGHDLEAVALGIKTYTESIDTGTSDTIKALVRNAETLVFLGFGFLAQNVDLLTPPQGSLAKRLFATTFRISRQDTQAISHTLTTKLGTVKDGTVRLREVGQRHQSFSVTYEAGTCRNLMDNNLFSLADQ
jgi:hypothetical protein